MIIVTRIDIMKQPFLRKQMFNMRYVKLKYRCLYTHVNFMSIKKAVKKTCCLCSNCQLFIPSQMHAIP